ncbi:pyocin knob domain-containing protein, partial [Aliarcobacter cryaerophilus]
KLTGNQTIAGVKTFSASPIVPTPTTDFQAVTKKYTDNVASGYQNFGLGLETTMAISSLDDNANKTGFYFYSSSDPSAPNAENGSVQIYKNSSPGNDVWQQVAITRSGKMFVRYSNGTPSTWKEILVNDAITKGQNGYVKLSNGLIFQWGIQDPVTNVSSFSITLPIAFPTSYLNFQASHLGDSVPSAIIIDKPSRTNASFKVRAEDPVDAIYWTAIGY